MVIGPKGVGKSTLLSFMALQWVRRYPGAQTFIFEQGQSARVATALHGGSWHPLGGDRTLALQPLAQVDDPTERAWAVEWVEGLAAQAGRVLAPEQKTELWEALGTLGANSLPHRTLTNLAQLLQDHALRELLTYVVKVHGDLLDANDDRLGYAPWQCFELGGLLDRPSIIAPTLLAIFHHLEKWLDGVKPTLFILDEAWLWLDSPAFTTRLRLWLKTLRKLNASVIFASQDLADVAESSIATTIAQECATRLFLPNPRALEPLIADYYGRFGLTPRQIELIATARPKRHYYYQSTAGCRLFDLELGPLALACAASSSKPDLRLLEELESKGLPDLDLAWLEAKGVLSPALIGTEMSHL